MKTLGIFLRGLAMGACDVIPGISGSTIGLITGVYENFILGLDKVLLFKKKLFLWLLGRQKTKVVKTAWNQIPFAFLFTLFLGIALAIVSAAHLMEWLIAVIPVGVFAFFIGLIATSAVVLYKKTYPTSFLLGGVVVGAVLAIVSPIQVLSPTLWYLFIAGALASATMLLPGLSGSLILLLLGVYDLVLSSVRTVNMAVLGVVFAGIIVGVVTMIPGISWLLKRRHEQTLSLIIGFVFGSLLVPARRLLLVYQPGYWWLALAGVVLGLGVVAIIAALHARA